MGVTIVRVIGVESLQIFPKYLRNCLEYSDQPLLADRYYGVAGADSQEFMKVRMGAAWKRGKFYGFLLSFHMVDFVLASRASAKGCKFMLCENLVTKMPANAPV